MAMGDDVKAKPTRVAILAAVDDLVNNGIGCSKKIEDFDTFCNLVLTYESRLQEKENRHSKRQVQSDDSLDSDDSPSPQASVRSEDVDVVDEDIEYPPGHESFENITCFCGKPFAGRPMIECSRCMVWIHMSCAKVRPSSVPDVWVCQHCKEAHPRKRGRLSRSSSTVDIRCKDA